jgi:non-ribosomal peptide synthetase component F
MSIGAFSCIISDSIHERQINMTAAKMYWRQVFKDYKIEKPMILPVDRKVPPNRIYTGQGFTIGISFNSHIVKQLVDYASRFNVTLYKVCLTIYYIFLFKLTGGQEDLIVGIVQANRYRPELRRIIGMFVNTLPIRVRVDPQETFEQLLGKVSNMLVEAQPYSNLPYQYIIDQLPMKRLRERNLIETMFTLDEYEKTLVRLDNASVMELCSIYCLSDNSMQIGISTNTAAMFDMTLSMEHIIATHSLRAQFTVSSDLFDSATTVNMAKRFQLIVEQLFSPISMTMTTTEQSIYDLSLILPEEMTDDIEDLQSNSTPGTNFIGKRFLTIVESLCLFLL